MELSYGCFDLGMWDVGPGDLVAEDDWMGHTGHNVSAESYGVSAATHPAHDTHPLQLHEHQTFYTHVPECHWQPPVVDIALATQHLYSDTPIFNAPFQCGTPSDGLSAGDWMRLEISNAANSSTDSASQPTGLQGPHLPWPPAASDIFKPLSRRSDPPETDFVVDFLQPQPQNPRFEGDLYTAQWIRGDGPDRFGWCGYCSSWWRLKDSAYWV